MKDFYISIFYIFYKIGKPFGLKYAKNIFNAHAAFAYIGLISIFTIMYFLTMFLGSKFIENIYVLLTFYAIGIIYGGFYYFRFLINMRYLEIEKYFDENKQRRMQAVKNFIIYLLIHIGICLFAYLFGTPV